MKDYCDLCDKEKEVEIGADRLRVCEDCEEKYPNDWSWNWTNKVF